MHRKRRCLIQYLELGTVDEEAAEKEPRKDTVLLDATNILCLQSHALSMGGAPSLGSQGLSNMYSHDLGAMSQGLAAGILSAMSGQLNGLYTQVCTSPNVSGRPNPRTISLPNPICSF